MKNCRVCDLPPRKRPATVSVSDHPIIDQQGALLGLVRQLGDQYHAYDAALRFKGTSKIEHSAMMLALS